MNRANSAFGIRLLLFLHAIEMLAQSVEAFAADIELRLHPLLDLAQPLLVQAVDPRRRLGAIRDEAALAQDFEMSWDRWSCHVETRGDVTGIALPRGEHRDDLTAGRIGEGFEGVHGNT